MMTSQDLSHPSDTAERQLDSKASEHEELAWTSRFGLFMLLGFGIVLALVLFGELLGRFMR